MLRVLSDKSDWDIFGSISVEGVKRFFSASTHTNFIAVVDLEQKDSLVTILDQIRSHLVVNCAGVTKHLPMSEGPLA